MTYKAFRTPGLFLFIPALALVASRPGLAADSSLRDGLTAADQAEEKFCAAEDVRFVRIPPSGRGDVGGTLLRRKRLRLACPGLARASPAYDSLPCAS